jgi:uncharacterized ferritin-like protein (DUF455 family)
MSESSTTQAIELGTRAGPETWVDWARAYIFATELTYKLAPAPLPARRGSLPAPLRVAAPGRPPELQTSWSKYKAPKSAHALHEPRKRAQLLHTFLHHELQAAELMCWAVLAFPEAPDAFAHGLLRICQDEIRHMRAYQDALARLNHRVGDFPVRDWFWERAPCAQTPAQFVALMGLGFEAGNLDHSARFEQLFAAAGDADGAALLRAVGEEEVQHVAFAAHWFERFVGALDFDSWLRALPAPLSPMVMRGRPLAHARRSRAGLSAAFLEQLEAWQPRSPGG